MALIEFKNKPDRTTSINANNLNFNFKEVMNLIYPVNSIVIKADNEDYSDWLGFEWERTLIGRVPVGIDSSDSDFNAIDKVGGSKYTEKHSHGQYIDNGGSKTPYTLLGGGGQSMSGNFLGGTHNSYTGPQVNTTEFGTGDSGNLQPYQVVAFWKRVA